MLKGRVVLWLRWQGRRTGLGEKCGGKEKEEKTIRNEWMTTGQYSIEKKFVWQRRETRQIFKIGMDERTEEIISAKNKKENRAYRVWRSQHPGPQPCSNQSSHGKRKSAPKVGSPVAKQSKDPLIPATPRVRQGQSNTLVIPWVAKEEAVGWHMCHLINLGPYWYVCSQNLLRPAAASPRGRSPFRRQ